MLTIEPPIYQVRGTTVFRDHADPDLFHVLPWVPALVTRAGEPGFTLVKYRRDLTDNPALDPTRARGGGLATFDVETTLPPSSVLVADVAARAERPEARVEPVVFRTGTVRSIIAHRDGDGLVEDVVESSVASVTAPHRATFALALTPEGATLFEAAASGGQLPVGVAYELRFLALTPALHAHVVMDDDRAWERLAGSIGFTYYVNVGLDAEIAELVADGTITIEITQFTDDDDQRRQHQLVLGLLKARVQQDFFRPTIPTPPQPGAGGMVRDLVTRLLGETVTSASALFVLKAKVEVVKEEKTFELHYDGRTAVELTHVTTGGLATTTPDGPSLQVLEVDLDDDFFDTLDVTVRLAANLDELPELLAVAVHLAHGDFRTSVELGRGAADAARFVVPTSGPRDDTFTVETEYRFDPTSSTGDPVVRLGPVATRDRVVVVSPGADLQLSAVRFVAAVDWTRVARVELDLVARSEDGAVELLRHRLALDAEHPEATWRDHRPAAARARLSVRPTWEELGGARHEGDREALTGSTFVVRAGFGEELLVKVLAPLDWTRYLQAVVELHYEDGDHVVDRVVTFDASTPPAPDVAIPVHDPTRRAYRWRATLVRLDGTTHLTPWAETDSRIVAAHDPTATTPVTITWVGDPAGALGLRVDLHQVLPGAGAEHHTSLFLRPGDGDKVALLPSAPGQVLSYRYEVRRVTEVGEELVTAGLGATNLLIVRAR